MLTSYSKVFDLFVDDLGQCEGSGFCFILLHVANQFLSTFVKEAIFPPVRNFGIFVKIRWLQL